MNRFSHSINPLLQTFLLFLLTIFATGCAEWDGKPEEVVFFGGGGIDLHATLAFPEGASTPAPAIVLLHGSERATRNRFIYPMTGNLFLRRGLAVFVYDKRGAGQSGGDYDNTTYEQLIQDAVAAIDYLRGRDDIDPNRIGIYGVSESGWLRPEIIDRSGNIAFLINKSSSTLSVRETIAWEIYNDMLADGIDAASARQQTDIRMRIWRWQESQEEQERLVLQAILDDWSNRADSALPTVLTSVDQDVLADRRYDPRPFLEKMTTPSLYLYGSEDVNIPSADSLVRIDELVEMGVPIVGRMFDGEGHELGGPSILPPFYAFADGFTELIVEFTELHVGINY